MTKCFDITITCKKCRSTDVEQIVIIQSSILNIYQILNICQNCGNEEKI